MVKSVERKAKDKSCSEREIYGDSPDLLRSTMTTDFTSGTSVVGNNTYSQKPVDR